MIRRHLKLFILILMELALLLFMAAGSFGDAGAKSFVPSDFYDNVRGRTNISVNEDGAHFEYDPKLVIRNDEGDVMGDDLLTGKFALGSGAYILSVDYKAEASNAYVELYSLNALTEPVSEKIYLTPDRGHTWGKIYVPFARSLHDIQMNIHYTGPGRLTVYGIDLKEDVSYRWVPLAGYLLLFIFLDCVLWLVFAVSEAEKALGGGTGKLKLRYAYNIAIKYFPTLTKMIPFSVFSSMVDKALETMRLMIDTNKAISDVINNKDKDKE